MEITQKDICTACDAVAAIKAVPRWQADLETELARRLQRLFDQAAAAVISEIDNRRVLPAGIMQTREVVKPIDDALGQMPRIAREQAVQSGRRSFEDMLARIVAEGWEWVGRELPQVPSQIIDRIGERTFIASQQTMNRIRGDVIEAVQGLWQQGLNSRQAVPELAKVFESMRDYELERVARTEVHSAAMDSANQTMTAAGVRYHKWVSATDERTRQTHMNNNGLITQIGTPYPNGLRYAGDRNGAISEWINCRCRMVPIIVTARGKKPPLGKRYFRESEMV